MKSVLSTALLVAGGKVASATLLSDAPIVNLGYTRHGATINSTGEYPYYNFTNIRFAEAPTGNLRFAAPLAPQTTNLTVDYGQQGPIMCAQAEPAWEYIAALNLAGATTAQLEAEERVLEAEEKDVSNIPPMAAGTTEDCLFLDVIVPEAIYDSDYGAAARAGNSTDDKTGYPVLVWIYGGGYVGGSKTSNGDPATLISHSQDNGQDGVVYVAINYRLGMFGFLSGSDFQAEDGTVGMAAFYDQRFALEWVQEYISLFGGDPNQVTVVGESAGAGSIMHQITAFGGKNGSAPFQRAIMQSPGFFVLPGDSQQNEVYQQTLNYSSIVSNKTVTSVADLRNLTFEELYEANYAYVANGIYGSFTYGPAVDGVFVPAMPGVLLANGEYDTSVAVMLGHNSNEGALFSSPFITTDDEFTADVEAVLPLANSSTIDYITNTLYPPVYNGTYNYTTKFERTSLITAELAFTCNTRYFDKAYNGSTYSYYFSVPPGLHGDDLEYTFYNGDQTTEDEGLVVNATVATVLQKYVVQFVMTGDPNTEGVPYFPMYGNNITTLNLNITDLGALLPDTVANERCDYWQQALYY